MPGEVDTMIQRMQAISVELKSTCNSGIIKCSARLQKITLESVYMAELEPAKFKPEESKLQQAKVVSEQHLLQTYADSSGAILLDPSDCLDPHSQRM